MAEIFTAVKPQLFVSKIMGLGPFYIDEEKRSFRLSVPGLIYSGIVLCLFSGVSAYVLFERSTQKDNKKSNSSFISDANDVIQLACGIAVTVCAVLLMMIQRNKFIHVVQNLHEVSAEMSKLDIALPYQTISKYSQVQIVILFILIVGLFLHDYLSWASNDFTYPVYYWISYFAPNFYNFMMEYQFISGALLLKKHFTLLNDYLMRFNDYEKVINSEETKKLDLNINNNGWMDNFDSHMGPKILEQPFTAWDGSFSRFRIRKIAASDGTTSSSQASLAKIKVFRKIHSSLCEIKESLNSAFSLQLLSSVAQAFVIITSDLYQLFTTLSKQEKAQVSLLTYPIVWSLTHVIELVFIVVTCTKTSKMANQTAVVVHKLLAKDCEPDIRNQLKLFSIQLLHRKISFTACGFFTLDMTLLQAIIGAATTYLVILIQFHNTYESS